MNNILLPLVKIESMSSLEIAELTGKKHSNVLRDIRNMLLDLYGQDSELNPKDNQSLGSSANQNPKMDSTDFKGVLVYFAENGMTKEISLDKSHTLTLITGYSTKLRKIIVDRWQFLEDQLKVVQSRTENKKHQLEAMEALSHLLPDDLSGEALNYIKANTTVNKAVSNLFGFPKMLKKAEMSEVMLSVRDRVLDDYIKLYEVLEDPRIVKDVLYAKYQPRRLGVANAQ